MGRKSLQVIAILTGLFLMVALLVGNPTKADAKSVEVPKKILRACHFSLQFSDSSAQQHSDASNIFNQDCDWVTGTEAGENPLQKYVRTAARKAGYTFFVYKSNWVAVDKANITKGSYKHHGKTIIENDLVHGRGHDTNITWATFRMKDVGKISVLASHYPTKGRPRGPDYTRVNLRWTKKIAHAIGHLASRLGAGKALVFYGGDQNIDDSKEDTFFGERLTSAGDELHKHPKTHWAPIDVIASLDKDGRVSARWVRLLRGVKRYSDHRPTAAAYEVVALN